MALRNCIKDINFPDPVQIRRIHGDILNEVSCKAGYISSKYNVQINPLYFEWNKFIPTLERQFPDVIYEILNCDYQWHPSDQIESRFTISRNGEPNYNPRRLHSRAQML